MSLSDLDIERIIAGVNGNLETKVTQIIQKQGADWIECAVRKSTSNILKSMGWNVENYEDLLEVRKDIIFMRGFRSVATNIFMKATAGVSVVGIFVYCWDKLKAALGII